MSTTPTPEAPSPELLRMHNAGQLLANCAFNIAQHAGEPISESVAATLKQCQSEWDAACLAFKAARAALPQGAGEAVEPVAIPPGFKGHGPLLDALLEAAFHVSRDGANTFDAVMFQDALHKVKEGLPAQQAVARALEELKFHPQASHVEPNYRDWFNKTIDAALRERNP